MRDHLQRAARSRRSKAVVGVRELKTHAGRILRHVREARASYILTHRGRVVGVILPLDSSEDTSTTAEGGEDAPAAWDTFLRAGRRLERGFRPGVSGVRLLSTCADRCPKRERRPADCHEGQRPGVCGTRSMRVSS